MEEVYWHLCNAPIQTLDVLSKKYRIKSVLAMLVCILQSVAKIFCTQKTV